MKDKGQKRCDELQCRGYLADECRLNFKRDGYHKQDGNTEKDNEIPAHHDHGKPAGNNAQDGQRHKATGKQRLVGKGIQVGAQDGPLIQHPRQKTVEGVCYCGQAENGEGLEKRPIDKEDYRHRYKNDPEEG